MLDFSRCRLAPFAHQKQDTQSLIEQPYFFIASECRTGKSLIVIAAAQFLFETGIIDRVIVITPAPVRDVWFDKILGEIAKHSFLDIPSKIIEFHSHIRTWSSGTLTNRNLEWYISGYEFLRSKARLAQIMPACGPKTLLVGDESSFLKNHKAQQTIAFAQLRKACGRVVLLNGTPVFHSPRDLFSQANILHPSILNCPFMTHFLSRYAVQRPVLGFGGRPITRVVKGGRQIVIQEVAEWCNLDDLERRLKPFTVRRLQAECLDLPPKLDPVTLTATLDTSWPHYKSMKEEMVVWLQDDRVATSATAAIKVLRLSQITGGFLGGVEESGIEVDNDLSLEGVYGEPALVAPYKATGASIEVGREKLDVLLWFIEQQLEADPNFKVVMWSRYRNEVLRAEREVKLKFPQFSTGLIWGNQKKTERLAALALLKPETAPVGPVFVAGIEGTGSFGLDMTSAHTCVTMSSGYSPGRSAQTLDRVYGPGQTHPVAYYDIVAVGPKGQRTIDHDILVARRAGEDVARRTAAAWVKALEEE